MHSSTLQAHRVILEHPEDDCHFVGFTGGQRGTDGYFMLQRSLAFSQQAVRLGMDTYHLEWCDQRYSSYGGIARFLLADGAAEIIFNEHTRLAFDGLGRLLVSFQLEPAEYQKLQQTLGLILQNSDCLVVANT